MTDYGEMLHVLVFVSLQHLIFCFPDDDSCCCFLFCFFCCVARHQAIKTLIRSK